MEMFCIDWEALCLSLKHEYVKLIPGIKNFLRRCTTMNVGIKGFGAYAPKNIIDNAYFEQF